jgi:hypothetical protein
MTWAKVVPFGRSILSSSPCATSTARRPSSRPCSIFASCSERAEWTDFRWRSWQMKAARKCRLSIFTGLWLECWRPTHSCSSSWPSQFLPSQVLERLISSTDNQPKPSRYPPSFVGIGPPHLRPCAAVSRFPPEAAGLGPVRPSPQLRGRVGRLEAHLRGVVPPGRIG